MKTSRLILPAGDARVLFDPSSHSRPFVAEEGGDWCSVWRDGGTVYYVNGPISPQTFCVGSNRRLFYVPPITLSPGDSDISLAPFWALLILFSALTIPDWHSRGVVTGTCRLSQAKVQQTSRTGALREKAAETQKTAVFENVGALAAKFNSLKSESLVMAGTWEDQSYSCHRDAPSRSAHSNWHGWDGTETGGGGVEESRTGGEAGDGESKSLTELTKKSGDGEPKSLTEELLSREGGRGEGGSVTERDLCLVTELTKKMLRAELNQNRQDTLASVKQMLNDHFDAVSGLVEKESARVRVEVQETRAQLEQQGLQSLSHSKQCSLDEGEREDGRGVLTESCGDIPGAEDLSPLSERAPSAIGDPPSSGWLLPLDGEEGERGTGKGRGAVLEVQDGDEIGREEERERAEVDEEVQREGTAEEKDESEEEVASEREKDLWEDQEEEEEWEKEKEEEEEAEKEVNLLNDHIEKPVPSVLSGLHNSDPISPKPQNANRHPALRIHSTLSEGKAPHSPMMHKESKERATRGETHCVPRLRHSVCWTSFSPGVPGPETLQAHIYSAQRQAQPRSFSLAAVWQVNSALALPLNIRKEVPSALDSLRRNVHKPRSPYSLDRKELAPLWRMRERDRASPEHQKTCVVSRASPDTSIDAKESMGVREKEPVLQPQRGWKGRVMRGTMEKEKPTPSGTEEKGQFQSRSSSQETSELIPFEELKSFQRGYGSVRCSLAIARVTRDVEAAERARQRRLLEEERAPQGRGRRGGRIAAAMLRGAMPPMMLTEVAAHPTKELCPFFYRRPKVGLTEEQREKRQLRRKEGSGSPSPSPSPRRQTQTSEGGEEETAKQDTKSFCDDRANEETKSPRSGSSSSNWRLPTAGGSLQSPPGLDRQRPTDTVPPGFGILVPSPARPSRAPPRLVPAAAPGPPPGFESAAPSWVFFRGSPTSVPPAVTVPPLTSQEVEDLYDIGQLDFSFHAMGLRSVRKLGKGGGGVVIEVEVQNASTLPPFVGGLRVRPTRPSNGCRLCIKLGGDFDQWRTERNALVEAQSVLGTDCVGLFFGGRVELSGEQPLFVLGLELCEEGDLAGSILRLFSPASGYGETEEIRIAEQLCDLVERAQQRRAAHLDLKLENVFVRQSGALCLGDLSGFQVLPRDPEAFVHLSGVMYTPGFCVPWLADLLDVSSDVRATTASLLAADRWSLGMSLFYVLLLCRQLWHLPPGEQEWRWSFNFATIRAAEGVDRQLRELAACSQAPERLRQEAESILRHPLMPAIRGLLRSEGPGPLQIRDALSRIGTHDADLEVAAAQAAASDSPVSASGSVTDIALGGGRAGGLSVEDVFLEDGAAPSLLPAPLRSDGYCPCHPPTWLARPHLPFHQAWPPAPPLRFVVKPCRPVFYVHPTPALAACVHAQQQAAFHGMAAEFATHQARHHQRAAAWYASAHPAVVTEEESIEDILLDARGGIRVALRTTRVESPSPRPLTSLANAEDTPDEVGAAEDAPPSSLNPLAVEWEKDSAARGVDGPAEISATARVTVEPALDGDLVERRSRSPLFWLGSPGPRAPLGTASGSEIKVQNIIEGGGA
uniref:Protein kinase domain-containing protein n=1 Tax=Chromera velia CCMP2878 TaxID=1169474 RepID=A0A0G4HEZ8_9ALVE|eukprot:Cvel_6610.t1-p1 / transcript=Cvel_6610.t1 / gene=Cvel_6610 / organism=Chromera_velia_CCMP2878 / gene_product=hypothetical protein / transcript_product=hypothetical protein / location=Cvel_scaffold327:16365-26388(+) / protein_length=1573 / sequence_SO=supercontig / SO=protein_coding / is_pseudo=false